MVGLDEEPRRPRRDPFEDMVDMPSELDDQGATRLTDGIVAEGEESSHSEASPEVNFR